MDTGSQIIQILLSFFNIVVTAMAAFLGAWLTYVFQGRKEREHLEGRLLGNINLLQDDLESIAQSLDRLPNVLDTVKQHYLKTGQVVAPRYEYPKESLLQAKYDITFLSHRASLTGPLGELNSSLSVLSSTVPDLAKNLVNKGAEVSKEAFLKSREMSFLLPLKQVERAKTTLDKVREELEKMKAEILRGDFCRGKKCRTFSEYGL